MNTYRALKTVRPSTPSGALPEALRAWANWVHSQATLAAAAKLRTAPELSSGPDLTDWRNHMSIRERAVLEACISAGIWRPE